jgi:hypothetical protein
MYMLLKELVGSVLLGLMKVLTLKSKVVSLAIVPKLNDSLIVKVRVVSS